MDPSIRLRIATRIHFALLRHFDENVDVETLLAGGEEAREALWVCEASQDRELAALARAFRAAEKQPARPAGASQDPKAAREHSGFGTTAFGVTGFGQTGFGTTGFGEVEPAETRQARGSWFGKLTAVLPR